MIPALVLTAGLVTRLRPLSLVRAKAAMPVGGEPIVRRILRWLRASGIQEAVLNLHHIVTDGLSMGLRSNWRCFPSRISPAIPIRSTSAMA